LAIAARSGQQVNVSARALQPVGGIAEKLEQAFEHRRIDVFVREPAYGAARHHPVLHRMRRGQFRIFNLDRILRTDAVERDRAGGTHREAVLAARALLGLTQNRKIRFVGGEHLEGAVPYAHSAAEAPGLIDLEGDGISGYRKIFHLLFRFG
jgi:hypothetical protein